MFQIWIGKDCPKGWAYVKDYLGNLIFYGTIKECADCIDTLLGFNQGGDDYVSDPD